MKKKKVSRKDFDSFVKSQRREALSKCGCYGGLRLVGPVPVWSTK